jgi:hypothetical protein
MVMSDEDFQMADRAKEFAQELYELCKEEELPTAAVALIMLCATFLVNVCDTKEQLRERSEEFANDMKGYANKAWDQWEASQGRAH